MELALDVRDDTGTRREVVDLSLDELEDTLQVIKLVGAEALAQLAKGWNADAARAILYVKMQPGCEFSEFTVDWPFPDPKMEQGLAEVQEANN